MVGVSLLSRECLVNDVEFINSVDYEEIMWMRVSSERGREALYIGCVYMPTDSTSISAVDSYERLKNMYLVLGRRERFVV